MNIVILLYKGFTSLDVIGPYEILCRFPGAKVKFAAKEKGIIESEYPSMQMIATHSIEEIEKADILLVPGSTKAFVDVANDKALLMHIKRLHATTQWTTSVCSGSIILAAAGILKGLTATSHWAVLDLLMKYDATPSQERYIRQGKIITGAGVSAGIDMALYLANIMYGEEYAKVLQLVIEYYPNPPVPVPDLASVPKTIKKEARSFLKRDIKKMSGNFASFLKTVYTLKTMKLSEV